MSSGRGLKSGGVSRCYPFFAEFKEQARVSSLKKKVRENGITIAGKSGKITLSACMQRRNGEVKLSNYLHVTEEKTAAPKTKNKNSKSTIRRLGDPCKKWKNDRSNIGSTSKPALGLATAAVGLYLYKKKRTNNGFCAFQG
eukprot:scaffold7181_cov83-Skeletonema_dohrnii-CCMP3373.AAC.2